MSEQSNEKPFSTTMLCVRDRSILLLPLGVLLFVLLPPLCRFVIQLSSFTCGGVAGKETLEGLSMD